MRESLRVVVYVHERERKRLKFNAAAAAIIVLILELWLRGVGNSLQSCSCMYIYPNAGAWLRCNLIGVFENLMHVSYPAACYHGFLTG